MRKLGLALFVLITAVMTAQEEPLVSNIFQDTYILDALADISAQTGIPIIADTTVTGFITMELNEVPLEQALKMILMPGGYVFKKMDGFYFV
jgi:type II secretory pathway component HofQ